VEQPLIFIPLHGRRSVMFSNGLTLRIPDGEDFICASFGNAHLVLDAVEGLSVWPRQQFD
jgi:hypothetical protein